MTLNSPLSLLLVASNTETRPYPVYPLGLNVVLEVAQQAGLRTALYDVLFSKRSLEEEIVSFAPDLVGISIRNIDDTDSTSGRYYLEELRQKVALLREESDAVIVLGGSGYSLMPEAMGALLGADFGVCGSHPQTLVRLARHLEAGEEIPPLPGLVRPSSQGTWRRDPPPSLLAGEDKEAVLVEGDRGSRSVEEEETWLNPQHRPSWLMEGYLQQGGIANIGTRRGCARHCVYCTYPLLEGSQSLLLDPGEVAEAILRLKKEHPVRYLYFVDSVFNLEPDHSVAVAEEMIRRDVGLPFGAFFEPVGLSLEELKVYQRAGLKHVEFGTDSLCDETLRAYGKHFQLSDVLQASHFCAQLEIPQAHFLILAGPGETPHTLEVTLQQAAQLPKSVLFPFVGMRIFPGTPLHRLALREEVVQPQDDLLRPVYYFSRHLPSEVLQSALEETPQKLKNWVTAASQEKNRAIIERLWKRKRSGPLWEYLLSP